VIALLNVGRALMVIWIIYGVLLMFAPSLLHHPPDDIGGAVQIAIAFGLGYLMDRGISAIHRRRAASERTGTPAPPIIGADEIGSASAGDGPLSANRTADVGFHDGQQS
jgi:hypothetical protein